MISASTIISEEEKESIVNKVNEALSLNKSNENIQIQNISEIRIKDIFKIYIIPLIIITIMIVILYSMKKLGILKITLKTIVLLISAELTYFSFILITRLTLGRITLAIAIFI